jgi:hypothetical protein
MNRTIEIIIGTTGEIQIDAVGFKGPDCEKATAFLEEALGRGGEEGEKARVSSTQYQGQSAEGWRVNRS